MIALVTGATGLIGNAIVRLLVEGEHKVRALVRDPERAAHCLPALVERVRGDVTDSASLAQAVRGVEWVFHAAGLPEQWQRDESIFDRVNRQGTRNLLEAAHAAGVRRVIYTSTMDVFAAPRGGTLVETNLDAQPKHTAYERSKQAAEREAEKVRAQGLEVVYVNPAAVYGPSPVAGSLNGFFVRLLTGKIPMLPPGGLSIAYVDGVAAMHLAAAERGHSGERYLLADTHVSNTALARAIVLEAGLRKVPPTAPGWLVGGLATVSAPLARWFRFRPLIAPGELTFLRWDVRVDATKARRELGFQPTALAQGVARTVSFFQSARP